VVAEIIPMVAAEEAVALAALTALAVAEVAAATVAAEAAALVHLAEAAEEGNNTLKYYLYNGKALLSDTITKYICTGATKLRRYQHSSIREDFHPNCTIGVLIYTVEYKVTHNLYFCRFWSKQEDDKPYLHSSNNIQQHHCSK